MSLSSPKLPAGYRLVRLETTDSTNAEAMPTAHTEAPSTARVSAHTEAAASHPMTTHTAALAPAPACAQSFTRAQRVTAV